MMILVFVRLRMQHTSKDGRCGTALTCRFSANIKSCLEQKETQKEAAGQPRMLCSCASFCLGMGIAPPREIPGSWESMGCFLFCGMPVVGGENSLHDLSLKSGLVFVI